MRTRLTEAPAFAGAAITRPFEEPDRLPCQRIAAEAARSSYAAAMPDLAFDGQDPLEAVDQRWVALWDGRIVGFVDLVGNHIANLFVDPSAQGRGVGTMLITLVERETIGDLTLSVFTANRRARALYQRLGFEVVSDGLVPFRGATKRVWRMRKARPVMARYRLVVFDFDGVLADSADWMLRTVPVIAEEFGLARLTRHELQALRGAPTRAVVRALRVPAWKMPFIARRMRQLSTAAAGDIVRFPGAIELLQRLKRQGVVTAVVSSNGEAAVRSVLGEEAVAAIDHLDCRVSLFGKAARLRRLTRKTGIAPDASLYVGDESRDIDAAAEAGFHSAAATWGYSRVEAFSRSRPTVTVGSIEALGDWLVGR
ncbi:GNAT family N-acetyltransferase [Roseibacterium beibuensis]|uniref:GNAT family N-acetyltransferase n=1 Tax=[Roseibacterium] beibuensis TaxID=1193142 RepID=UPI00217E92FD|nr:GNAT family N-acetyltransferase [Roseibacterium beibuensis]MCS6624991.1 GNAT family N-acetyltransferase [Roseibacterium beibuensis]